MSVEDHDGNKCCVYHNSKYSGDMLITGGIFDGYDNLIYSEKNNTGIDTSVTFLNSEIRGNKKRILHNGDNKVNLFIKNTFSPTCKDAGGNPLADVKIKGYNSREDEIFELTSDGNGRIYVDITVEEAIGDADEITILNPITLKISYEDISFNIITNIVANMKDFDIFVVSHGDCEENSDIDYDKISSIVDSSKKELDNKLNSMDETVIQLLHALGKDIKETHESVDLGNEIGTIIF